MVQHKRLSLIVNIRAHRPVGRLERIPSIFVARLNQVTKQLSCSRQY